MCVCQGHRRKVCHFCLYVDDMIIVGSNDKCIKSTKNMLNLKSDMKDIGRADVILGVKINRTFDGFALS